MHAHSFRLPCCAWARYTPCEGWMDGWLNEWWMRFTCLLLQRISKEKLSFIILETFPLRGILCSHVVHAQKCLVQFRSFHKIGSVTSSGMLRKRLLIQADSERMHTFLNACNIPETCKLDKDRTMEIYKFFNAREPAIFLFFFTNVHYPVWLSLQTECRRWSDAENKLFLKKRFAFGASLQAEWWTDRHFQFLIEPITIFFYGGYKRNAFLLEGFRKCLILTLDQF